MQERPTGEVTVLLHHAVRKQALKRGSEIQSIEGAEDYAGLSLEQAEEQLRPEGLSNFA